MIDWFTVFAQIVNFLILVGLLKYFLYGRILAAMEKRQQEVNSHWEEAQRQRVEAKSELDASREKNRQLEEQREQLLAGARDEAEQYRQQLTAKVREDVYSLHQRWTEAVEDEKDAFLGELRQRASAEVFAIARRALAELANASLEQQIVERFLHKVERLGDAERREIVASLHDDNRIAVVQTTCRLTDDLQNCVTRTLQERLATDLQVQFEQSEELLCGIALQTNAHKLAWSLHDYFSSLERELQQAMDEATATRKHRQPEKAER